MGRFKQKQHDEANDKLLNLDNNDGKFDSLVEVLKMLTGEDGKKNFAQLVAAEITTALGEDGAITNAISGAITAALGEGGDITNAISSAITAAIGTDGAIETWGDGRYEPKQP